MIVEIVLFEIAYLYTVEAVKCDHFGTEIKSKLM